MNEYIEFQQRINELDGKFNGQATIMADKNPHMSLDKIEGYLTTEVKTKEPT